MQQVVDFIQENLWICIIVGFLVIVVGDEFLGVTKALFGDDDDYGLSRGSRKKIEKISEEAERDFPEEEDSVSIEDMLSPKKRG